MTDRIIVLVDMDCFYVQVEQRLQPQYFGKPCAVVQYNSWKSGGIIAVNYEARDFGVKRGMRGDMAKQKCPDIHLFQVPELRGKADLTRYRDAGAEVIDVLSTFSDCVERASIDEAYLDMTKIIASKCGVNVAAEELPHTSVVGWDNGLNHSVEKWLESINECGTISDKNLAIAASIVEEMRTAIFSRTKFKCSAGISYNKMLAKLACGLHKPNHQTILPQSSVMELFKSIPIHKLRNLGGKLGDDIKEKLEIETIFELSLCNEKKLKSLFGDKTGKLLCMWGGTYC
ncbi:DNA polymerase eta-like [Centruroides sculpturatus]|uniref:DNA polymerase eta-like n=1 Tax=Centruroides sculpturatus TaxID=218467 RepID=UPI000C6EE575|nr:DNA polymerase eta-like [Centruroides sculpturatus]XP_023243365.1 DNA polymerase eta-like [Centruroides sculpturatus]